MTSENRYISFQSIDSYEGEVHSILFSYDKDNRRIKVSDNTGAVMEYEYNNGVFLPKYAGELDALDASLHRGKTY